MQCRYPDPTTIQCASAPPLRPRSDVRRFQEGQTERVGDFAAGEKPANAWASSSGLGWTMDSGITSTCTVPVYCASRHSDPHISSRSRRRPPPAPRPRVIAQRHGQENAVLHGDLEAAAAKGKMPSQGRAGLPEEHDRRAVSCAVRVCYLHARQLARLPVLAGDEDRAQTARHPADQQARLNLPRPRSASGEEEQGGYVQRGTWLGKIRPRCEQKQFGGGAGHADAEQRQDETVAADTAHAAKGAPCGGWGSARRSGSSLRRQRISRLPEPTLLRRIVASLGFCLGCRASCAGSVGVAPFPVDFVAFYNAAVKSAYAPAEEIGCA